MGLDTTHGCYSGAYSGFNEWRRWLAGKIDIDLLDYIGYGGSTKRLEDIEHNLEPLFNHSDCDGELSVEECKKIKIGLEEIFKNLDPDNYDERYNYEKTQTFIEGLELAIEKNEPVEFL